MEVTVVINGAEWLQHLEQTYEGGLKFGLGEIFATFEKVIQERTPVDVTTKKGSAKPFGKHLQESWNLEKASDGWSAIIGTPVVYAPVLDAGSYPGVGPRTIASHGGIFSRQAPGGIIKPMIEDQKLIDDAIDMVIQGLDQKLDEVLTKR